MGKKREKKTEKSPKCVIVYHEIPQGVATQVLRKLEKLGVETQVCTTPVSLAGAVSVKEMVQGVIAIESSVPAPSRHFWTHVLKKSEERLILLSDTATHQEIDDAIEKLVK